MFACVHEFPLTKRQILSILLPIWCACSKTTVSDDCYTECLQNLTTHKSFKHMKSYQWWFVPRLPKPFPSVISNTIRETISGGILSVYYNHRIGGTLIQKPIFDRISEWNSPDLIKPDFDCCLHECHSKNVSDAPSINTSPCATSGSGDTSWDWDEASISNTRFRHIFIYLINILVIYHSQLKPERYHEVTDGTGGCRNDNLRCRQWRPSWHHDNSLLQGLSLWSLQCYWMSHRLYCQPYCALWYFFLATLSVEAPVAICLWWYRYWLQQNSWRPFCTILNRWTNG